MDYTDYYLNIGSKWIDSMFDSVYHRRCNAIAERLINHGVICTVYRHDMFNVDYYVVDINEEESHLLFSDVIPKLSSVLGIPESWIAFLKDKCYIIKEKEFNDRYLDKDGEMDLGPYDFFALFKNYSVEDFEKLLNAILKTRHCENCKYDVDSELLIVQYNTHVNIRDVFKDLGVELDEFVCFETCIVGTSYSICVINMEDLMYGDD